MLLFSFAFPTIDPVALTIGPFQIYWYALAYVVGIVGGIAYGRFYLQRRPFGIRPKALEESVTWLILGMVIGGRLGHVFFYDWPFYRDHPWDILATWKGGMSFHGGLVGVAVAAYLFARSAQIPFMRLADLLALLMPIGLFFGRLANFINGELYGRMSDVAWAVLFPRGGDVPRHPSQLYEAVGEGLVLALVLSWVAWRSPKAMKPGFLMGLALLGYGGIRFMIEFYREVDLGSQFFSDFLTMGQWLSVPMMALGGWLMKKAPCVERVRSV